VSDPLHTPLPTPVFMTGQYQWHYRRWDGRPCPRNLALPRFHPAPIFGPHSVHRQN